jgi:hypothetical protein
MSDHTSAYLKKQLEADEHELRLKQQAVEKSRARVELAESAKRQIAEQPDVVTKIYGTLRCEYNNEGPTRSALEFEFFTTRDATVLSLQARGGTATKDMAGKPRWNVPNEFGGGWHLYDVIELNLHGEVQK